MTTGRSGLLIGGSQPKDAVLERVARALGIGHVGMAVEWKTLLPGMPEATWRRYFIRVHVVLCKQRDALAKPLSLTEDEWRRRYITFSNAVMGPGNAAETTPLEADADGRFYGVNYLRICRDIGESLGSKFLVDCDSLQRPFFRIGYFRFPKKLRPGLWFARSRDWDMAYEELSRTEKSRLPIGLIVPVKAEVPARVSLYCSKLRIAVFGLADVCRLKEGRLSVRRSMELITAAKAIVDSTDAAESHWSGDRVLGAREVSKPAVSSVACDVSGAGLTAPSDADRLTALLERVVDEAVSKRLAQVEAKNVRAPLHSEPGASIQQGGDAVKPTECGRLQVIKWGSAILYDGEPYKIRGKRRWEIIEKLMHADGELVDVGENPGNKFSGKGSAANNFWTAAVKASGRTKGGSKTYKLVK